MDKKYDILILGGGPIGASTAYFLSENGAKNIALVCDGSEEDLSSTFRYAGGSVRAFWDDPLKVEMTKTTMDFILDLDKKGVDLSLIRDNYLFLNKGKYIPSLNISGKKLVNWFLSRAKEKGLTICEGEKILSVTKDSGFYTVRTDKNEYKSNKVLLALGSANSNFVPEYKIEKEKRQLFVLDIPVGKDEESFPHTIIPIKNGVAYVFIKKMENGLRFVVGQEDILEENDNGVAEDYFAKLLESGLGESFPFLKNAKVENILWGFDVKNKILKLEKYDESLFVANCGSAIRSCVWIGRKIAEKF